jgi:ribosomal protein S18 acetylase RimI-like enzyme
MSHAGAPTIRLATALDAEDIAAVRTAAAQHLTAQHGRGHWSSAAGPQSVLRQLRTSRVLVARRGKAVVGTVRVEAKKPWAIDVSYFATVDSPTYLHDLAVAPDAQGHGVGRRLVEAALTDARRAGFGAVRLDAYNHAAGAGGFYVLCGFREVGRVTYRGTPLIYYERVL